MMQMIVKPQAAQRFAFNTPEVDDLYSGFKQGEFTVILFFLTLRFHIQLS